MPRQSSRLPRFALFIFLSATDFLLTWWLLQRSGGLVYESNPIAAWTLERFGWLGLAGFKTFTVALALTALAITVRCRSGDIGLMVGCFVLLGVVGYSGSLVAWLESSARRGDLAALEQARECRTQLESEQESRKGYYLFVEQLHRDVCSGKRSLPQAAQMWLAVPSAWVPDWLVKCRRAHSPDRAERYLATRILSDLEYWNLGSSTSKRLATEYQMRYGSRYLPRLGGPGRSAAAAVKKPASYLHPRRNAPNYR